MISMGWQSGDWQQNCPPGRKPGLGAGLMESVGGDTTATKRRQNSVAGSGWRRNSWRWRQNQGLYGKYP